MLIRRMRLAAIGVSAGCLVFAGHQLKAQWGNNAPPCSGPCVPVRQTWGYYKTCWHPWPCAMHPAATQRPGGMMESVPSTELPSQRNEAEIRVPTPARRQFEQMGPGGGFEPGNMPIPADRALEPAPRGGESSPGFVPENRSNINEVPMTLPPEDPTPSPMGSNRRLREANPRNPAALPRLKLRSSGADNVAEGDALRFQRPRVAADERNDRATYDSVHLPRHSSPRQQPTIMPREPELLMPPSPSKPLHVNNVNDEQQTTSANPLRSGVIQASVFEEDEPNAIEEGGPSPASGAARVNPLRR
jgi:hypothetical protein